MLKKVKHSMKSLRVFAMIYHNIERKTVLAAFRRNSDMKYLQDVLSTDGYRILKASDFVSLIESLNRYRIHLIISEVKLPGISMTNFLPFLRQRYMDIKVIIVMKNYSPRIELLLRSHKILYVMPWPVSRELLRSVISNGLERLKNA